MKTVSVSEIIRTAQMGNTRYVLLTEAEAEIAALRDSLEISKQAGAELAKSCGNLHERQRLLVEAVKVGLKRNHIITDAEDFKQHLQGTWVAIPEQNFDHIRAALAAKEG